MTIDQLKANKILRRPILPEPLQAMVSIPMHGSVNYVELRHWLGIAR